MDDPTCSCSLGLLNTYGSEVLSCTGSLGGSRDDLRAPVACVGVAKPLVLRVKGLWQPWGAVTAEALLQAFEVPLLELTEVMPSSD